MAQMLISVNETMDKLLKKLETTTDLEDIKLISVMITDEVYLQWKDKEIKVITHEQKMEMQEGEVEECES